jgi:hypothetical protein
MRFVNTFEKHRSETGKSLDAYPKERRLGLGEAIADRHKVYLDTKYWLLLREDKFSRSHDPVIAKLSELLHEGVRSKRLICPISTDIVLEIFKQSDPVTLGCSVELVDTPSGRLSARPRREGPHGVAPLCAAKHIWRAELPLASYSFGQSLPTSSVSQLPVTRRFPQRRN